MEFELELKMLESSHHYEELVVQVKQGVTFFGWVYTPHEKNLQDLPGSFYFANISGMFNTSPLSHLLVQLNDLSNMNKIYCVIMKGAPLESNELKGLHVQAATSYQEATLLEIHNEAHSANEAVIRDLGQLPLEEYTVDRFIKF